ncbi:MAG: hypothetical protein GY756_23470 [bacterium]|nr:hypothetical protein [bacterium]
MKNIKLYIVSVLLVTCCIAYSNTIKTTTSKLNDVITAISLSGNGNLYLKQGNSNSITIKASKKEFNFIKTKVEKNTLSLNDIINNTVTKNKPNELLSKNSTPNINYYVTLKNINKINKKGFGFIKINNLTTPELTLNIAGYGKVNINNLTTKKIYFIKDGYANSTINFNSKVELNNADFDVSGYGNVILKHLNTKIMNFNKSDFVNSTVDLDNKSNLNNANITVSGYGQTVFNHISTKQLQFTKSGFANVSLKFNKDNLALLSVIKVSNYGKVKIENLHTEKCTISKSGPSYLTISGSCTTQVTDIAGDGNYNDNDFSSKNEFSSGFGLIKFLKNLTFF